MTELLEGRKQKLVSTLQAKGIRNPRVLEAFRKIPRHLFVDKALYNDAYEDNALPIGNGQTISQPYVVALMTEALELEEDEKILEIGTGSGFQAAILSRFSRRVYTVERDRVLGERARALLRSMNIQNVMFKIGDGSMGWRANAPYDRIVVTAGATESIPQALVDQLADGGRMLIPSGTRSIQELLVVDKKDGKLAHKNICDVVFVPLVGKQGWS